MSVNQRVFSIVVGAVRLHDSVLEFLTGRRELASEMDIFSNSSSYGFQLQIAVTLLDIHLSNDIRFRRFLWIGWTGRNFDSLKRTPFFKCKVCYPFQFFVFSLDCFSHPSAKSIHRGYVFQKRMHLGQHILVIADTYSFSRFGSRTHNIDFRSHKGHVFQLCLIPGYDLLRQISQMRCRCRSQPMLTEKYFAYFFHIIFDLYPYPPFFRHSSTKRDKQEKHYGRNNTCPNEHDNMLSFHFVPP